ncbi:FxSxx-COOH system tetratricopeptide repeat protein [Streptomyces prasinus]|uniref:FxSxx-COOH system tetratricopeptide repeat protein n=1 Tax=Streptomyces prasinus TaxID=67345 RepID=UPI0036974A45
MRPQRLARIRTGGPGGPGGSGGAGGSGGSGGSGSGYLIGPQLVLTALHVVLHDGRWAGRVAARVGHPRAGAPPVDRAAQVCWPDPRDGVPAADAPDVALLWLDEPVTADGGPVRWGRPAGVAPLPFEGAGFPAFAAGAGSGAHVEYLRGKLPAVSTSPSGWVLDCEVWPAPGRDAERPWAGASGSAVFCHGRLVGVAVEDDRTMGYRRLHAVPLHEVLSLPGFADLVARHGHPGTTTAPEDVTAEGEGGGGGAAGGDAGAGPVVVGVIPTLASAFQPRSGLRERIDRARAGGGSVVLTQKQKPLTQDRKGARVLSGGGGVGKTQLAAACATDALEEGADVVVWATATEAQQVITQYARAATALRLPGATGQDPENDARTLLNWLAATERRWLVVLDDVTDPTALDRWWPVSRTGTGWALATTRLRDARLTGGGRTRVDIDVYTADEADAFLRARLAGDGMEDLLDDRAPALAENLGHLPLALGLAAAYMINEQLSCTAYLRRLADRRTRLEEALPETADTEAYGRRITATLLLSLDAVRAADPTGLAVPVLRLAALLDPTGHPHALWTEPPLLDHLTTHRTPPGARDTAPDAPRVTADQAHTVLRLLHRYALLTCDTRAEPRAVRVHALTARAVRENTPASDLPDLAVAAADALLHTWPETDQPHADLAAVLRANTDALAGHVHEHLWVPEVHPVLFRAGNSLLDAGLADAAVNYWQGMAETGERLLEADDLSTLTVRCNLASSHRLAGRNGEAVGLLERVLADSERLLGADHPGVLVVHARLAVSYREAGRTAEAIRLLEWVLPRRERLLGDDHPDVLTDRALLAVSYQYAGRTAEAVGLLERVLADRERLLGDGHPDTLITRVNLAVSYGYAGRNGEAVDLLERGLADSERLLGDGHPDTLTARVNLAVSYGYAGRNGEAVDLLERGLADRERLLGDGHPDVLTARANLAVLYGRAGRTGEAVGLLERVLADRERLLGTDHPDTLTSRYNLASSYWQAGRTAEAVGLLERAVRDGERLLGADHPTTLTIRAGLASARRRQAERGGSAG